MKRVSMIMLMAAAIAAAGCKKKSQPKPASTAGTATPPAGTGTPPAGTATPTAGTGTPPAGTGAPAAMSDAEFEALMAENVTMNVELGKAVDRAGDDCGKTAAGLNAVLDKYAAMMARGKALTNDPTFRARAEAWTQQHVDQLMGPAMKVATAGQKCFGDPAFQQAMARLSP